MTSRKNYFQQLKNITNYFKKIKMSMDKTRQKIKSRKDFGNIDIISFSKSIKALIVSIAKIKTIPILNTKEIAPLELMS